jgi:hypothetical protein
MSEELKSRARDSDQVFGRQGVFMNAELAGAPKIDDHISVGDAKDFTDAIV